MDADIERDHHDEFPFLEHHPHWSGPPPVACESRATGGHQLGLLH